MRDCHRDPYEVLGISPGAPDEEVKRAFRRLAKQLHPDLRPTDASAELRFRQVVSAYQALTTSQSLAGHDAAGRTSRRWGLQATATTVTVFLLTVASVSLVALWREPGDSPHPAQQQFVPPPVIEGVALPTPAEPALTTVGAVRKAGSVSAAADPPIVAPAEAPKQRSAGGEAAAHSPPRQKPDSVINEGGKAKEDEEGGELASAPDQHQANSSTTVSSRLAGPEPGAVTPSAVRAMAWTRLRNARFGFSLAYPADIFVADPGRADDEAAFRSRDGRARFVVTGTMNRDGTRLAVYRRSLMQGPYRRAAFDYTPRRPYWFVLSGTLGDAMFYERVTFSCDRRTFHSWKLVYPLAERALYDRIVEEVHRRYRSGNGVGGYCGETGQQTSRASRPDAQGALQR